MRVVIENANSKMWNIETKVAEIIYSLINDDEVIIDLNSEGPCCEDIGLYDILDFICEKFEFAKSNVCASFDKLKICTLLFLFGFVDLIHDPDGVVTIV